MRLDRGSRRRLVVSACLLGLALSACIPQGTSLPQSPLLRSLERKSGLIAYLGTDANIYTIDQAGGHQTALTTDAHPVAEGETRLYDSPTWSPRSREVAYVGVARDASGVITASVHVSPGDGSERREIFRSTERVPIYLYWSPEGDRVSFLTQSLRGGPNLALHVSSIDEGEARLVDSGRAYYWAWSPDGQGMFVHVGGTDQQSPGEARMSFLALGPEVSEMGLGLAPARFQAPAFSPDGGHVLFAADSDDGRSRLILASTRDDITTPAAEVAGPVAFAWSPKGDYIAYAVAEPTADLFLGDLFFLDVRDRHHPVSVPADSPRALAFFWSPDGDRLATISLEEQEGIRVLVLNVIQPDSGGTTRLASFVPSRAFVQILPFFDQYQRSSTIWSPDGNYLVVSSLAGEGRQGIFVVPSSGKFQPRFVVEGVLAFWSHN